MFSLGVLHKEIYAASLFLWKLAGEIGTLAHLQLDIDKGKMYNKVIL